MVKMGALLSVLLMLSACNGGSDSDTDITDKGPGPRQKVSCPKAADAGHDPHYGCQIELLTPNACEELDLTPGRVYEFSWTTNGTVCETPYTFVLAGSPFNVDTGENMLHWKLSSDAENGVTQNGVSHFFVSAEHLVGLTSDSGWYHWNVAGWSGFRPASRAFGVTK